MKSVYTCRLARIYCKRFLRFLSDPDRLLLFAILKINNRKSYPRWRTARRPGDRGTKDGTKYFKPILRALSLLVAIYRMCNETETTTAANTSPLDPVNFTIFDHVCWPFTFLSCEAGAKGLTFFSSSLSPISPYLFRRLLPAAAQATFHQHDQHGAFED